MNSLLVEVDEALKQERIERLWKQYGGFFLGFIAAIIIGTGANAAYHHWKEQQAIIQSSLYLDADETKDANAAEIMLNASQNMGKGLESLAKLKSAGLFIKQGDHDKAIDIYMALENNENTPQSIKQAAFFMHTNLSKTMTADEKITRLNRITSNNANAWKAHANLDLAILYATQKQDYTQARTHLKNINSDINAPETLQQKAQSLDILYALKEKISARKATE